MDFANGETIDFFVLVGRISEAGTAVYDTAQYDQDVYDGSTDITFQQIESRVESVNIRRGKDAFNKRFRTSTATVMVDNFDGDFTDGPAQPGDFVWIRALRFVPAGLEQPVPIPDQTTWQGDTGRTWTANGDGLVVEGDPAQVFDYSLFYGRIDSAVDVVKGGVDYTKLRCVDLFSDLAIYDGAAELPVGAGDNYVTRVGRWTSKVGTGWLLSPGGTAQATMQETTLAGQALSGIQLTVESEGGDAWMKMTRGGGGKLGGIIELRARDWLTELPRSTNVQWRLGQEPVELADAKITRNLQLVYNDATYSSVGGIAQNATDTASTVRYGTRTYRRLDLVCEGDTQPAFLANRLVTNQGNYQPRVEEVTITVDTPEEAAVAYGAEFGDLVLVVVKSLRGWSKAYLAHIRAIEHEMWHEQWTVTLGLSNAFIPNEDGDFSYLEFDGAYSLGGQPERQQLPFP